MQLFGNHSFDNLIKPLLASARLNSVAILLHTLSTPASIPVCRHLQISMKFAFFRVPIHKPGYREAIVDKMPCLRILVSCNDSNPILQHLVKFLNHFHLPFSDSSYSSNEYLIIIISNYIYLHLDPPVLTSTTMTAENKTKLLYLPTKADIA